MKDRICRALVDNPSPFMEEDWSMDRQGRYPQEMQERAEIDEGQRPGLTTTGRERLKELEKENKELRRANEILKAAAALFGAELDRRPKK
jgi:transposase-like protein